LAVSSAILAVLLAASPFSIFSSSFPLSRGELRPKGGLAFRWNCQGEKIFDGELRARVQQADDAGAGTLGSIG
jgi:hypothetical protein